MFLKKYFCYLLSTALRSDDEQARTAASVRLKVWSKEALQRPKHQLYI